MTEWKLAMIAITPLLAWNLILVRASWRKVLHCPRLRTWVALFSASLATSVMPSVGAYVAIDIIAGAIVLRHPAGLAQRMIGFLFVCMVLFELGYLLSDQQQTAFLVTGLTGIGWMQWAILALWGTCDAVGYCLGSNGAGGRPVVVERRL